MRRRLLLSYLAVAVLVLALLEIPLGISYANNERQDLTHKVERDAVAVGSLSEDVLERGVSAPPALEALGARYARDTGARVVVVDAQGRSVVDSAGTTRNDFSTRPELRTALGGTVATGVRHSSTLGTDRAQIHVGSLEIDVRGRRATMGHQPLNLTTKEFDLLALLASEPGDVVSRQRILREVWDTEWFGPTKTVDVHVASLRKKLGEPGWIETVRGIGLRLVARP